MESISLNLKVKLIRLLVRMKDVNNHRLDDDTFANIVVDFGGDEVVCVALGLIHTERLRLLLRLRCHFDYIIFSCSIHTER